MGGLSWIHWVVVLVVVLAIFGTKKLRNVGSDLGAAVKGFKDGVREGTTTADPSAAAQPPQQVAGGKATDANTVDVEAKTKS